MKKYTFIKPIVGVILIVYALAAGLNALLQDLYVGYNKSHFLDTPLFWVLCAISGMFLLVTKKK